MAEFIDKSARFIDFDLYKRAICHGARICAANEDTTNDMTEDDMDSFIDSLTMRGHWSPLEHGTIRMRIPYSVWDSECPSDWNWYNSCPYAHVSTNDDFESYIVTTNYRVILENECVRDMRTFMDTNRAVARLP